MNQRQSLYFFLAVAFVFVSASFPSPLEGIWILTYKQVDGVSQPQNFRQFLVVEQGEAKLYTIGDFSKADFNTISEKEVVLNLIDTTALIEIRLGSILTRWFFEEQSRKF